MKLSCCVKKPARESAGLEMYLHGLKGMWQLVKVLFSVILGKSIIRLGIGCYEWPTKLILLGCINMRDGPTYLLV